MPRRRSSASRSTTRKQQGGRAPARVEPKQADETTVPAQSSTTPETLPPATHIDRPARSSAKPKAQRVASTEPADASTSPRANPGLNARRSSVVEPQDYSADQIRGIRDQLGASQTVFASLLGVSKSLVEHWERGIRGPSVTVRRLLDAIQLAPASFVDRLTVDRKEKIAGALRSARTNAQREGKGRGTASSNERRRDEVTE
jgi:putative transcriptional regulator